MQKKAEQRGSPRLGCLPRSAVPLARTVPGLDFFSHSPLTELQVTCHTFTLLRCTIQCGFLGWGWYICKVVAPSPVSNSRTFPFPERDPKSISAHSSFLPSPHKQESIFCLQRSVCSGRSCRWNHTTHGLLCLSSTQHVFQGSSVL